MSCSNPILFNRRPGLWTLLVMLLSILCLLAPDQTRAEIVDRVVAVAGNRVVTTWALQQAIRVEYDPQAFADLTEDKKDEIIKRKLDSLINNLLIAQKAATLGLQVSDDEVNATIKRVLTQNNMTEETLKRTLAQQGLDFSSYYNKIASDLLKSRLISKEIKANIIITEKEIMEYAEKHNLFSQDETVTIAQIFIPKNSPNAAGGADNKIWKTIRKRLKNEENFFALASEFSEGPAAPKGGRLGTFKKGSLLKEIEEVAFKLPLGQASKVIKTGLGYHMIVVTNRTGADEKSLTPKAENKIKGILYNEKLKEAIEKLGQDLRSEYKVKIILRNLPRYI